MFGADGGDRTRDQRVEASCLTSIGHARLVPVLSRLSSHPLFSLYFSALSRFPDYRATSSGRARTPTHQFSYASTSIPHSVHVNGFDTHALHGGDMWHEQFSTGPISSVPVQPGMGQGPPSSMVASAGACAFTAPQPMHSVCVRSVSGPAQTTRPPQCEQFISCAPHNHQIPP